MSLFQQIQGDIAIDDVQIEDRTCPKPGSCDFESTPRFCTWYNIQSNKKNSFNFQKLNLLHS